MADRPTLTSDNPGLLLVSDPAKRLQVVLDEVVDNPAFLSHAEFRVLVTLAHRLDDNPTVAQLADLARVSPSTVKRATRKAEERGWLIHRVPLEGHAGWWEWFLGTDRQTVAGPGSPVTPVSPVNPPQVTRDPGPTSPQVNDVLSLPSGDQGQDQPPTPPDPPHPTRDKIESVNPSPIAVVDRVLAMVKAIRAGRAQRRFVTPGADRRIVEVIRPFLDDPAVDDDDLVEACIAAPAMTANAIAFQINLPRADPIARPRGEQGRKVRLTSADYDNPDRVWD